MSKNDQHQGFSLKSPLVVKCWDSFLDDTNNEWYEEWPHIQNVLQEEIPDGLTAEQLMDMGFQIGQLDESFSEEQDEILHGQYWAR